MSDRKAELERKKERLRQMREEKEKRKREKERLDAEAAASSLNAQSGASSTRGTSPASSRGGVKIDESNLKDIDKTLADMGIAPVKSVLDSMSSQNASGSSSLGNTAGIQASVGDSWASPASLGSDPLSSGPGAALSPRQVKKELSVVTVQSTNIAPKVGPFKINPLHLI